MIENELLQNCYEMYMELKVIYGWWSKVNEQYSVQLVWITKSSGQFLAILKKSVKRQGMLDKM